MGEDALRTAIEIVGGQSKLAKILGVSQPSIWHWLNKSGRVPGEHVIAIERATGGRVTRRLLRPDIFPPEANATVEPAEPAPAAPRTEEEVMRGHCYALLGRLLAKAPDATTLAALGNLSGAETDLGAAIRALAEAAAAQSAGAVEREYFDLFIGVGRGELVPYGSYYLTGFLHEKPLAKVRGDMAELGIARNDDVAEPEDHIASLCETMAGLIAGAFGGEFSLAAQRRFFDRHLAPWAGKFFDDLERAERAALYRRVAAFGRLFIAIERDAFAMAA